MKINKPSEQDNDAAVEILQILQIVSIGYHHSSAVDAPVHFNPDDAEHLRSFYDALMGAMHRLPGGFGRVMAAAQRDMALPKAIKDNNIGARK